MAGTSGSRRRPMSIEPIKQIIEHIHLTRRYVVKTDRVATHHVICGLPLTHEQKHRDVREPKALNQIHNTAEMDMGWVHLGLGRVGLSYVKCIYT